VGVRTRSRLGVTIDRDWRCDSRQGGQWTNCADVSGGIAVRIRCGDIEADRVWARRSGVGIKNSLPKRAHTAISRGSDSKCHAAAAFSEQDTYPNRK